MSERVTYYVQYSGGRTLGYEIVGAEHGYAIAECSKKEHAERIAAALNAQAGVVEAARRYYEGWCQDEASDEPEDGSDRCRWTGCTVEQRDAARALRDAIAAVKGVES